MALMSLSELNRAYMAESQTAKQKTFFSQAEPQPIVARMPKTMGPPHITDDGILAAKPPTSQRRDPAEPGAGAGLTREKLPGIFSRLPHVLSPAAQQRKSIDSETSGGQSKKTRATKKNKFLTAASAALFAIAILLAAAMIVTSGSDDKGPKTYFGHAFFNVLTNSMDGEIPQGAFIVVKQTDTDSLEIGDDITYRLDEKKTVTHKIIDVIEDYENSGSRGFQTKGVNNVYPDQDIVLDKAVVGKVEHVVPKLGAILSKMGEKILLIYILIGLCLLSYFVVRSIVAKSPKRKQEIAATVH